MAGSKRNAFPLILIPAAGESTRFKAQGYHTPKPFLKIRNAAGIAAFMLEHVLATIPEGSDVRVIVRDDMEVPFMPSVKWVFIDQTSSHPETILKGLPYEDRPVLLLDCDMLLAPQDIAVILEDRHAATVGVADSWNPGLARVDSVEYPRVFADAPMLSPWSIISARAFEDCQLLTDVLHNVLGGQPSDWPAPTMSHVLNLYPGMKKAIVLSEWTDWGTPEAVRQSGAVIL